NGSLINGGSFSDNTPWNVGSSYYSTGSNSYIQASGPSLLTGLNALTFSTWINLQESPKSSDRIFSEHLYSNGNSKGFDIRFDGSKLSIQVNGILTSITTSFNQNQWIFLAVTYDANLESGNLNLY